MIQSLLEAVVAEGRVPGAVAMVATRDGALFEGAAGRRSLDAPQPMTKDTVFWIASMTKAITSLVALQLVDEGRLALDAPLGHLAPHLRHVQVLEGFDEQGAPRLRPPARPVTLRHLLTHTSGLSYETWDADVVRYMSHAGLPSPRTGKIASLTTPLLFDPGEQWRYGINIEWVGRVIEAVLDAPLDRVLHDRVFEPLGMVDTGYVLNGEQEQRRATVHNRGEAGSLTPGTHSPPVDPEFYAGGSNLFSTAPDYLRFLRLILNGGALDGVRLLSSSMVAEMGRNQIGNLRAGVLRTAVPALSRDIDLFPGMPTGWSLGFLINTEPGPNGRAAGSLTWAGLGNCYYWIDPTHGVTGVLMTQVLPFGDPDVLDLLGAIERAAYAVAHAE